MNQGYIDSNSINSQKILMNSDISRRKAPETWLKMATGAIIEEALMPAGTTTLRQSHHHKELEMPFLLPIFLLEHLKMDV